jgi:flagellin
MVIAHNIGALNANKNLYINNRNLNSSLSKLSSGYRINTGADGPADLVISEKLRSQIYGLERTVRNTTEASNVLSIAEGALNEMNSILKKMKALAIHAANNGITSPDQVASDQAEMDSGVQTLERIANTTKFSDQFLLNGSKDITYNVNTTVKGTQNNQLVNASLSSFQQIFKRDGYEVTIGFNGTDSPNAATNMGNAAMSRQAAKGYLEIDAYDGTKSQINEHAFLTQGQSFILTGTLGSRQFNFSQGAHISEVVSAIKNVAGSTGVDASLIFNREQGIAGTAAATGTLTGVGLGSTTANAAVVYDNYTTLDNGAKALVATAVTVGSGVSYGGNTDGQGNIYLKVTGDGSTYEAYKDASLSNESLIASGASGTTDAIERNHSGLTGLQVTLDSNAQYGDVLKVSVAGIGLGATNACSTASASGIFNLGASVAAGVQLGVNTDSAGKIYLKVAYNAAGTEAMFYAYNNALMREEDLVAKTADFVTPTTDSPAILDSIWNDEHTASSGLGIALSLQNLPGAGGTANNYIEKAELQFTNLGARISTAEYGSDQSIKVQTFEGGLFVDYQDAADYNSATLLERGTYEKRGQDATVSVNGQQMKTNGLVLNLATPDIMASVTFNEGRAGTTTIAQVGYNEGSIFTRATALTYDDVTSVYARMNNAGHVTNETISNFQGGMQLQLGEGAGDQERTVIGLKPMSTAQLGRLEVTKQFDPKRAVIETRTLSIQNVMGGQVASLASDPALTMQIIDKAISDVSEQRATIGAVQANMLQTNENNLRVAIENITKTESGIRDTDMASEMTEFVKNQVLANAGLSMVAQANNQAQQVLALLQ